MSLIDVKVDLSSVRFDASKVPQAIARGLNEGGDLVRTRVQRALKVQTNVKSYRSITSRIRTVRAFAGSLHYDIVASGSGIPIEEFPLTVTGKGVDAKTWGVDHLFKRSFQEANGTLRARLGRARFPIRKLYGPSLPKELARGDIPGVFANATAHFVPPAIVKNLLRALG